MTFKNLNPNNNMPAEITGTLHFIDQTRTYGEKFTKRAFILRVPNPKDAKRDDYVPMACVRDRVHMLDQYQEGDEVTVSIDIKGRLKKNDDSVAYADLECWRLAFATDTRPPARQPQRQQQPRRDSRPPERDYDDSRASDRQRKQHPMDHGSRLNNPNESSRAAYPDDDEGPPF